MHDFDNTGLVHFTQIYKIQISMGLGPMKQSRLQKRNLKKTNGPTR